MWAFRKIWYNLILKENSKMRKSTRIALLVVLAFAVAAAGWAQASQAGKFSIDLNRWAMENKNTIRTVNNGSWSQDPKDAPSDADLAFMFKFACETQSAVNWNEYFFIAVRNPVEQEGIIGDAVWKGSTSPGTVTILILADQVADQKDHKDTYNAKNIYMQTTMSYFDSGMAAGFLNLAAYSLGYSTHYFASASGSTITPKDKSVTYGFGSYNTPNWDVSKFLAGKNYTRTWGFPNPPATFAVEGNCVMIAAVVVGKPNPKVDAVSAVTNHGRPQNWAIWDPQK